MTEPQYTAIAYLYRTGMVLKSGEKAFCLSSEGHLEEMFPEFPSAAILKYGYSEIPPISGNLQKIKMVMWKMDGRKMK
jgi:hypothetical protein